MHYEIMWNAFILQQEAETTGGKYEVDADKTLQSGLKTLNFVIYSIYMLYAWLNESSFSLLNTF